jgi:hypothetical protein
MNSPSVMESGSNDQAAVSPGTTHGRVRLVEKEEGACLPGTAAQLVMVAGLRLYDAEVRERRLRYNTRHVARLECLPKGGGIVEGDHAHVALAGTPDP